MTFLDTMFITAGSILIGLYAESAHLGIGVFFIASALKPTRP